MKILLFDVDGTLVRAGGAGRKALNQAVYRLYGKKNVCQEFSLAGRTDLWNFKTAYELSTGRKATAAAIERLHRLYLQLLPAYVRRAMNNGDYILPRGIKPLIKRLSREKEAFLGLGTGNMEHGARIKLEPSGLLAYFLFGGYGSDSFHRPVLLKKAVVRAEKILGHKVLPAEVYVIGDTPLDVAAGRKAGYKTVAVGTGFAKWDELVESKPDFLARDFKGDIQMAEMVQDKVLNLGQAAALADKIARSFSRTAALPSHFRAKVLWEIAQTLEKESEDFARLISEEVKKPLKESRREVTRAVFTFRWASEEAKRFGGEFLPLDLDGNTEGRFALTRRFPAGPALLITPFNFPLNLVAHKVAPAIAVGAPFVLKPAPQAPRTALKLAHAILAAGWPVEAMAVVSAPLEAAEALVKDDRFSVLSFTGSAKVGWHLKSVAGKKRVLLELGGNAAVLVTAGADIPWAAARCAWGSFYYSGQVCISVQRIYAEASIYKEFKDLLLKNIAELKIGDVMDEKTDIGPLISSEAAQRVEEWIGEAVSGGGTVLCGGKRQGDVIQPTLVENAPASCKLSCEEAFGPVATLEKVDSKAVALDKMSAGPYGLQAGIFTNDMTLAFESWRKIPVGGLIINDIPSFRSDAMPYGGVRDSGIGREGVRYAMEEFTDLRTLVIKP